MIVSSASPEVWMVSANSRCSLVSAVSSSRPLIPMIAFIGVRISWLMVARNALLAWFAASAARARLLRLADRGARSGSRPPRCRPSSRAGAHPRRRIACPWSCPAGPAHRWPRCRRGSAHRGRNPSWCRVAVRRSPRSPERCRSAAAPRCGRCARWGRRRARTARGVAPALLAVVGERDLLRRRVVEREVDEVGRERLLHVLAHELDQGVHLEMLRERLAETVDRGELRTRRRVSSARRARCKAVATC